MLTQSHLYQEIHSQPNVLSQMLAQEAKAVQQLAKAMQAQDINHIVIAARGTSDNAARYAQYLLGAVNGLLVTLATPSLFSIYQQPPRFGKALVLGISQSGQSPDIVAVLTEAKRQGNLTAAITNVPDSNLAKAADYVIDLRAGVERSVAATKTYTTELAAIAMLSVALAKNQAMHDSLQQLPQLVATTLEQNAHMGDLVQRYRYMQHCVVIGRGFNYATAFELALKLKELTYTIVEPYSSADFLHGPLALIEPGFPVIAITPAGAVLPEMQNFLRTVKERGAEVIAVSNDADTLALARLPLTIPVVPEWMSPLVTIIPGQLFAMNLAHARDFDVDKPRGLRKVTETR